ncbi:hypothetical protein LCGC14_1631390 [marine sediment metagenome]|uniref:Uncharacterized protein n=1 Tax=marine sediment metagenome TaxID=412755 RepID=A0A0F9IPN8_9ZZZZ
MEFIRKQPNGFTSLREYNKLWYLRIHGNIKGRKLQRYLYNRASVFLLRKKVIFEERR